MAGLALLLTPAVMMRVTEGWQWGPVDFALAAVMIFGMLAVYDAATRVAGGWAYRAGAALALAAVFLLVWITLAVGIIGDPGNPLNTMYFGVIALGLAGALAARFRPAGMARALFVAAFAQAAVAGVALAAAPSEPPGADGRARSQPGASRCCWPRRADCFAWPPATAQRLRRTSSRSRASRG